jgi:hypothetical protein
MCHPSAGRGLGRCCAAERGPIQPKQLAHMKPGRRRPSFAATMAVVLAILATCALGAPGKGLGHVRPLPPRRIIALQQARPLSKKRPVAKHARAWRDLNATAARQRTARCPLPKNAAWCQVDPIA